MGSRISLSTPTMNGSELKYIQEAFDTNWIAPLGPHVDAFEKAIASYAGVGYAAALSSGTAAIHLALKAAGVRPGDTVFCSNLTFSATCNPIIYEQAIPVFIDSETDSWNMCPNALEKAFEKHLNVRVVIVVNLYGTPARLTEISEICDKNGALLIEDAAESLGSLFNGKQTGSFGKFGIFSFNGNKIITTSGGGMFLCGDEEIAKKVRFWATQSRDPVPYYRHSELGYNYRMSNICAGIGRGQLKTLDLRVKQKADIYNRYKKAFKNHNFIRMNPVPDNCASNYWLSCITLEPGCQILPMDIYSALGNENIESRPIWNPMSLQPYYAGYDMIQSNDVQTCVSYDIFQRGLCLPSDVKMTEAEQYRVIDLILSLF